MINYIGTIGKLFISQCNGMFAIGRWMGHTELNGVVGHTHNLSTILLFPTLQDAGMFCGIGTGVVIAKA